MDGTKPVTVKSRHPLYGFYSGLIILSAVISLLLWVWVQIAGTKDDTVNYLFALMLGVTPFLASFMGFKAAREWGGLQSVAGRSIGALALGLLLWSIGEFIWSYYNLVLMEAAPYPSWADLGYASGVMFWILSAFYLASLTGVWVLMKRKAYLRYLALASVILSIGISYYLVVIVARQGMVLTDSSDTLKVILDIAYPLSDVISLTVISVVAIVAGRYLGGILKMPILLVLIGLLASYLFDLTFSYTTTIETYYNAQPTDILLLIATGSMSFALIYYAKNVRRLRSETATSSDEAS